MEYRIQIHTPQGTSVSTVVVRDVSEAYDLCREQLQRTPQAWSASLFLGAQLIHTMRRRD